METLRLSSENLGREWEPALAVDKTAGVCQRPDGMTALLRGLDSVSLDTTSVCIHSLMLNTAVTPSMPSPTHFPQASSPGLSCLGLEGLTSKPPENRDHERRVQDAVSVATTTSADRCSPEAETSTLHTVSKPETALAPLSHLLSVKGWWWACCNPPNVVVGPQQRDSSVVSNNVDLSALWHLPVAEAALALHNTLSAHLLLWMLSSHKSSLEVVWWERAKLPNMAAYQRSLYEAVNALTKQNDPAAYPSRSSSLWDVTMLCHLPCPSSPWRVPCITGLGHRTCGIHLFEAVFGQRN